MLYIYIYIYYNGIKNNEKTNIMRSKLQKLISNNEIKVITFCNNKVE